MIRRSLIAASLMTLGVLSAAHAVTVNTVTVTCQGRDMPTGVIATQIDWQTLNLLRAACNDQGGTGTLEIVITVGIDPRLVGEFDKVKLTEIIEQNLVTPGSSSTFSVNGVQGDVPPTFFFTPSGRKYVYTGQMNGNRFVYEREDNPARTKMPRANRLNNKCSLEANNDNEGPNPWDCFRTITVPDVYENFSVVVVESFRVLICPPEITYIASINGDPVGQKILGGGDCFWKRIRA